MEIIDFEDIINVFNKRAKDCEESSTKLKELASYQTDNKTASLYFENAKMLLYLEMLHSVVGLSLQYIDKLAKSLPNKETYDALRQELAQEISQTLMPIKKKFDKEKEIEDEINRLAKEREDNIGGMFG